MDDREPIEGRVAKVLSTREIVINKGTADGVEVGMIFNVLSPAGEDIRDPETGEILGSVARPKVPVQVSSVQDRLCVAKTYRSTSVNVGGMGITARADIGIARLFQPAKWVKHYE